MPPEILLLRNVFRLRVHSRSEPSSLAFVSEIAQMMLQGLTAGRCR